MRLDITSINIDGFHTHGIYSQTITRLEVQNIDVSRIQENAILKKPYKNMGAT